MKKISILAALIIFISACAVPLEKQQKDMQAQIKELKERIETLETKSKKDVTLKGDIYGRVDKLEERVSAIDENLAKMKSHPLFEITDTVKLSPAPSTNVISIKAGTGTDEPDKSGESKKASLSETSGSKDEKAEMYNDGYEMYSAGKYAQAVALFRKFLQNYAKDALADNAQYWIGECYYAEKNFKRAIDEFKKVDKFPDGNKVPDAYLKIMYAYQELKNKKEANRWKRLLLDKYKDSEAARKLK